MTNHVIDNVIDLDILGTRQSMWLSQKMCWLIKIWEKERDLMS